MNQEEDIQKLLRLKRYELPKEDYFEDFLRDFQRNQRAEMLRRPAWKIALDRAQAFFAFPELRRFSYAGAAAATLLVLGVTSFELGHRSSQQSNNLVAQNARQGGQQSITQVKDNLGFSTGSSFALQQNGPMPAGLYLTPTGTAQPVIQDPHYVIDTRPVSYEAPSFSF